MDRTDESEKSPAPAVTSSTPTTDSATDFAPINASGHRQELERNFNLVSICSFAITSGNTWVSLGGTVVRVFSHFVWAV